MKRWIWGKCSEMLLTWEVGGFKYRQKGLSVLSCLTHLDVNTAPWNKRWTLASCSGLLFMIVISHFKLKHHCDMYFTWTTWITVSMVINWAIHFSILMGVYVLEWWIMPCRSCLCMRMGIHPSVTKNKTKQESEGSPETKQVAKITSSLLGLNHLDNLVMTRIKAPFSSFSLWFSVWSSALTWARQNSAK